MALCSAGLDEFSHFFFSFLRSSNFFKGLFFHGFIAFILDEMGYFRILQMVFAKWQGNGKLHSALDILHLYIAMMQKDEGTCKVQTNAGAHLTLVYRRSDLMEALEDALHGIFRDVVASIEDVQLAAVEVGHLIQADTNATVGV